MYFEIIWTSNFDFNIKWPSNCDFYIIWPSNFDFDNIWPSNFDFHIMWEPRSNLCSLVLHLKGLTPNGMLPIGILDGQETTLTEGLEGLSSKPITQDINSFEDAKKLDKVNEKMPTRRKEPAESKGNSIRAQVATTSAASSSSPSTSTAPNNTTSNKTTPSAHTSKATGSSKSDKWAILIITLLRAAPNFILLHTNRHFIFLKLRTPSGKCTGPHFATDVPDSLDFTQ